MLLSLVLFLTLISLIGTVSAETYTFEDEGVACEFDDESISCDFIPASNSMLMSSSNCGPKGCEPKTVVAGRIINQNNHPRWVVGANVTVVCDNGVLTTKTTKSLIKGFYVVFFEDDECTKGDLVTVTAEKDGLVGSLTEKVKKKFFCDGHIVLMKMIPLIPEFGLAIGALTLVSAVGIFFFVRRK